MHSTFLFHVFFLERSRFAASQLSTLFLPKYENGTLGKQHLTNNYIIIFCRLAKKQTLYQLEKFNFTLNDLKGILHEYQRTVNNVFNNHIVFLK